MKLLSATLNHTIFNVSFKLKIPVVVNIDHASMYVCQFYLFVLISDVDGEGNGTSTSTLAWKIPWMEEPGGLQSMGSLRVGHDLVTSRSLFSFMHSRRKWQPTPVFLPGESQGWGSLVGCRLWGRRVGRN